MNENLDLVKILKDCPKGTKLYSTIYGDVELVNVLQGEDARYPIVIKLNNNLIETFTNGGRMLVDYGGECVLFPSREQRDWSKFKPKKPKFNPKTLKPFDKVLVRLTKDGVWYATFFSHYVKWGCYPFVTTSSKSYPMCVPYNDDTKYLVGTTDEAPEYYRYWE